MSRPLSSCRASAVEIDKLNAAIETRRTSEAVSRNAADRRMSKLSLVRSGATVPVESDESGRGAAPEPAEKKKGGSRSSLAAKTVWEGAREEEQV